MERTITIKVRTLLLVAGVCALSFFTGFVVRAHNSSEPPAPIAGITQNTPDGQGNQYYFVEHNNKLCKIKVDKFGNIFVEYYNGMGGWTGK